MASRNPHQSFGKILTLVFGIAFGIIALIMVYKAVQDNTERRSQAAEEQITYKQWEFNGKDAEGWKVPEGSTVSGGYLHLPIPYRMGLMTTDPTNVQPFNSFTLVNEGINTVLPIGNKQIKFMISAGSFRYDDQNSNPHPVNTGKTTVVSPAGSVGSAPVEISRTFNSELASPPPNPPNPTKGDPPIPKGGGQYTMTVSYATSDNTQKYIQIPSVIGVADGQSHEIAIAIPNSINEMNMSGLNVQFTNIPEGSEVRIDWIRLVSPKGKVIPPNVTPAPCKGNAVKSVTIESRCTGLKARSATYQCADGFTGRVGNGSTCEWGNTLRKQVQTICAQHRSCPITPTPQCTPLPICATEGVIGVNGERVFCALDPLSGMTYCPRSTPTPTPPGCYYQQVQCFKAPCDPILVCPSPTPTCQPRPSCLDTPPFCKMPEPVQGWCPATNECKQASDCGKPLICKNGKEYPSWSCDNNRCSPINYFADPCNT